jgi:hypothetical protein
MADHYTIGIGENGVYLIDGDESHGRRVAYSCRKINQSIRYDLLEGKVEPEDVKGRRVHIQEGDLHLAPECMVGIENARASNLLIPREKALEFERQYAS